MKAILSHLYEHNRLSFDEAKEVLTDISKEKYKPYEVASFMTVFQMRSISVDELAGFREALIELAQPVDIDGDDCIDLCGTGGDGKNTFNISTATACVLAALGKKVTKHGNYGVSSVCGSSNVLDNLGYRFSNDSKKLQSHLDECNLCFLHAPLFHPAMKFVAPIRREMGVKTFFNMLGPLVNPIKPKQHAVGVFSLKLQRLYSHLLQKTDRNYSVVYDLSGYDEVSLTGTTKLIDRSGEHLISPSAFGLVQQSQDSIFGGDTIEEAAGIFRKVLDGTCPEAHLKVVSANAAVALRLYNPEDSLQDSYELAKETILSGAVGKNFDKLVALS